MASPIRIDCSIKGPCRSSIIIDFTTRKPFCCRSEGCLPLVLRRPRRGAGSVRRKSLLARAPCKAIAGRPTRLAPAAVDWFRRTWRVRSGSIVPSRGHVEVRSSSTSQRASLFVADLKAVCRSFCGARGEERDQYGESLYLLEPHVKRSRGGLRDLHLLRWIGFAEHGESDPDRLFHQGAMSKFDHHRLHNAQAFLLQI